MHVILAEESAGWSLVGGLLSVPVLICLNAMFVAAQFALVALRWTRVQEMVKEGQSGAKSVERAMENLDHVIAATQLGTVLVGLLLGWIAERALAAVLQPVFRFLSEDWHLTALRSCSAVLTFGLITFMSVVFGEMIPKTVGLQNSERTAVRVARPILLFTKLVHPCVRVMDGTGNWLLRRFGYGGAETDEKPHSLEELLLLVEDSAEAGILTPTQATFVTNVFRLSDKRVRDSMVPVADVGMIEFSADPKDILKRIATGTYTRMPVYEGGVDKILGVANTKQLLRGYTLTGSLRLEEAIYPALFVKPDDSLPAAMKLLRQAKFPLALVRDDTGKIHGILTLEDIISEVIGEIVDEHDYPAPKMTPRMLQAMVRAMPKRKPGMPAPQTIRLDSAMILPTKQVRRLEPPSGKTE